MAAWAISRAGSGVHPGPDHRPGPNRSLAQRTGAHTIDSIPRTSSLDHSAEEAAGLILGRPQEISKARTWAMMRSLTSSTAHCERRVTTQSPGRRACGSPRGRRCGLAMITVTTVAPLNHARYSAKTHLPCLVTAPALSWQSGGQGRAAVAVAVSWWSGYRRAGGHRLFTANDPEPTGIARLLSGVRDSQSGCRTMRNRQ